jgi:hypothetical protein
MRQFWWPYRWQIGMMPFFAISIWLAFTHDIGGQSATDKAEFAVISVLYALADVLIVNYFVSERRSVKVFSQFAAMNIFACIFLYTYLAHGEAQYALAQPLYWLAGWKLVTRGSRWYPARLGEKELVAYGLAAGMFALWAYGYTDTLPTRVNLLQFVGLTAFGLFLAIGEDMPRERIEPWRWIGTCGVALYTATCLADAADKYFAHGVVIATPLVAFFAALPVTIVALRDNITHMRTCRA